MRVTLEGVCGKRLISLQYRPLALLFFVRDQSQFKLEEGGGGGGGGKIGGR